MITVKDIARLSGVSRTTVSAVLHGKPWVSEDTRVRVQRVLREQNYHHHLIAHSLSERFAKMIGVVIGNIRNPFNTELLSNLQAVLEPEGYFLVLHTTDETYDSEVKAIGALESYELGGYVVAPVQEGRPHDHLEKLVASGKPLVSIGELPGIETHVVDFDDRQGCKDATDYLIAKGHRRIACLAGDDTSLFAKHRVMGYIESLMDHRIAMDESLIVRAGDTLTGGYEAAKEVLARDNAPTALVCFNDLVAIGAYSLAYDQGLSIPGELSIVGFDDVPQAAVMGPPLTTVATYPQQLGAAAAEILMGVFNEEGRSGFLRRVTHPKLIERASVREI